MSIENTKRVDLDILNEDSDNKYELIAGKAFNYYLTKVKIRFNNKCRMKTMWFFISFEECIIRRWSISS